VWQGTDFDLDAAIRDQKAQIGKVDSADVLNEQSPLPAIVARRHAIETGNLRYFTPVFVSAQNISRIDATESPTIFVCLAETVEEAANYRARLTELGIGHSPAVICQAGEAIREAVGEVLALRRVQRQSAELANDPVGQRELSDRLATSQKTERELISAIIEDPQQGDWIIGARKIKIENKRQLQNKLSALLDQVYSKAPIIRNELINRERPSSTAMGGRKKLLMAMLDHPDLKDLGIEKFPAEKAMYRAVLSASGLHAEHEGGWQFQSPGLSGEDVARLRPMWDAVQGMLAEKDGAPVSLESIYQVLAKPPYGIKAGLLPILILAMYQAMKQELAITENGQFVPFLSREVLEGLIKDPKSYALQHFRIDGSCSSLFEHYAEAITGEVPDQANLISVLQPLAKLMVGLPDYTKQTKRISAEAQAVRNLFFSSKAPIELIFSELPKALGFDFPSNGMDAKVISAFSAKFKSTLVELQVAYHALLQDLLELLRLAFDLGAKANLDEVRTILRGRCNGLDDYTIDSQSRAFIGRLVDPYGDEGQWLVSLGSFLARKPPEKWVDDDLDAAKFRLTEFSSKVRDLFRLQLHYEDTRRVRPGDLEASLVRIISTRDGERQALVTLDDSGRNVVRDRAIEISAMLESLPSDELRLATLAQAIKSLIKVDEVQSEDRNIKPKHSPRKGVA
jgi:phenylpyruvate tautomerase PptA (4-oxalocrotonate tautomerase family)